MTTLRTPVLGADVNVPKVTFRVDEFNVGHFTSDEVLSMNIAIGLLSPEHRVLFLEHVSNNVIPISIHFPQDAFLTKYNFHTVLSRTKGEARYHRGHDFAIPNSLTGNVLAIHVESVVTKDGAIVKEGETIFLGENCSFWKKIVDKLPGGGGINGLNALEGAIKRSTEELQVTLSETNVAGCLCLYSIGGARVIGEELYNDNHAAFLYRIKDKLQLDLDAIKQHDPRVVNYNWIPDSELLKLSETQEGSVKFIAKTLYDVVNGKRPLIEISSMEKAYETEGNGIYLRAPLF